MLFAFFVVYAHQRLVAGLGGDKAEPAVFIHVGGENVPSLGRRSTRAVRRGKNAVFSAQTAEERTLFRGKDRGAVIGHHLLEHDLTRAVQQLRRGAARHGEPVSGGSENLLRPGLVCKGLPGGLAAGVTAEEPVQTLPGQRVAEEEHQHGQHDEQQRQHAGQDPPQRLSGTLFRRSILLWRFLFRQILFGNGLMIIHLFTMLV